MASSRAARALVIAGLLAVAAVTTLLIGLRDSNESGFSLDVSDAPGPFDARMDVGGAPRALGWGFGSVWIAVPARRAILRVDSRTSRLQASVPFEGTAPCSEIVSDDKWVWVGDCRSDSITVIDPASNSVVGTVQGQGIAGPASSDDGMWVWSNIEGKITLYDDVSDDWERKFQLWNNLTVPDGAAGFGAVWILDETARRVLSPVDERTGGFPDIEVEAAPSDVSVGAGAVWVASEDEGVVLRFDPRRRRFVARIEVGAPGDAIDLATADTMVWVRAGASLRRIDPRSNRVVDRFEVPDSPSGIAVGAGGVWIGNQDGSVWRLDQP